MSSSSIMDLWLSRLNIREPFLVILLITLGSGWISSVQRVDRKRRLQEKHLLYTEEELRRAMDELRAQKRGTVPDRTRSFWEADLEGSDLRGMTIASNSNAFQGACFRKCKLEEVKLEGGGSSFHGAHFDQAVLVRANLKGGVASFQEATFHGANLTDATLVGGLGSFQGASFEDAILIGATMSGNFQNANLSGARLQNANLVAIDCANLARCYFKVPPSYDSRTSFPVGFDPEEHLWQRVD